MASRTIKVTGISDELLQLLDARVQSQHGTGRSEYIRNLLRRDLLSGSESRALSQRRSFREILAPVYAAAPPEETEAEAEQFVDDLIATVRRERRARHAPLAEEKD